MRVFFSTGEASGDYLAASLGSALRARVPGVELAGIGGPRMAEAGFRITTETRGWASLGPFEALRRIPPLFANALSYAFRLRARPYDLIVLVDFGAYNLRLAKGLRMLGYRKPILYFFPPGTWLDRASRAREVAATTTPLTAFAHQRDFYRSLGLEIAYFGHPLVSLVEPRPARAPAPAGGGTVALLPGSRRQEIERHAPLLLEACRILRRERPALEIVAGASDDAAERLIARAVADCAPLPGAPVRVERGARAALDAADAAFIASGTAVLEAALREVPAVSLYVVGRVEERYARRIFAKLKRPYITLPNILLDEPAVPELLQREATPEKLAAALESLLADPSRQLASVRRLRALLGPPDALERCADFAAQLAGTA